MKIRTIIRNKNKVGEKVPAKLSEVTSLPLSSIAPNPLQPRKIFDEVDIVSLADSIRQHGLLQPITVRLADPEEDIEEDYVIVAGERRFRAVKMLCYDEIPCLVTDITAREAGELAIIENIMREDLSMFEVSEALKTLIDDYDLTQDELAKRLSTSQSNIANKLRLLRFSEQERVLLCEYGLTERHARAILRVKEEDRRRKCLIYIGEHHLSVKLSEAYIDSVVLPKEKKEKAAPSLAEVRQILQNSLKKPLDRMIKSGLAVTSEEIQDGENTKIIITIPGHFE